MGPHNMATDEPSFGFMYVLSIFFLTLWFNMNQNEYCIRKYNASYVAMDLDTGNGYTSSDTKLKPAQAMITWKVKLIKNNN